ncbi:MAG: hypothetical protein ACREO8_13875 [Luteimonas sp.]
MRGHAGHVGFAQAVADLPDELDYLVQPFVPEILEQGEWSLMFFGGRYSHAVLKRPLAGDYRAQSDFGGSVELLEPGHTILAAARRALQVVAALGHADQAYARVDGVLSAGRFLLMEIELVEPFLHLSIRPQAARMFAAQLAERLHRLRDAGGQVRPLRQHSMDEVEQS